MPTAINQLIEQAANQTISPDEAQMLGGLAMKAAEAGELATLQTRMESMQSEMDQLEAERASYRRRGIHSSGNRFLAPD